MKLIIVDPQLIIDPRPLGDQIGDVQFYELIRLMMLNVRMNIVHPKVLVRRFVIDECFIDSWKATTHFFAKFSILRIQTANQVEKLLF